MKKLFLASVALVGSAMSLWAQQEYIYVTDQGANTVTVLKLDTVTPTNAPLFVKTITDPVFSSLNAPYDILADSARRLLYVSNNGGPGAITVISGDTLAVIGVIDVSVGQNLKGMAISDDGAALFVAGQTSGGSNVPAVFGVNLITRAAATLLDSNGISGDTSEACSVIPASVIGGSGNGPGRVYYSVTQVAGPGGPGYIAFKDVGAGASKITMLTGTAVPPTLMNVRDPSRMSRSPDGTVVFVTCGSNNIDLYVVRIDAASNVANQIDLEPLANGLHKSTDVSFRPDLAPNMRAYVVGHDKGPVAIEVSSAGVPGPAVLGPGSITLDTCKHHVNSAGDYLYLGNLAALTPFSRMDTSGPTPALGPTDGTSGSMPTYFAFMTQPPAPAVTDTCPKGDVNVVGSTLIVHGANFLPGTFVQLPGSSVPVSLPTVLIDSGTLQATNPGGVLGGEQSVTVINPDLQQIVLRQFYCTTGAALTPWTLTLPSVATGYEMHSVPQYSSVSSLRAALAAALGPYNPVFYRVFFWDVDHYVELSSMTDDCDLAGRAFWVLTRFGGSATINGLDCFANKSLGIRAIALKPGWNMVSLPYQNGVQFRMNWGGPTSVQVTSDGTIWNPTFAADTNPALLNPLLYEYVNGAYATTNVMQAGRGYFVENVTSSVIYLLFTDTFVFKPGAGPAPSYVSLSAAASQPPAPPGAGMGNGSSSKKHGCGLLGLELLPVLLVFHRLRRRRRLGA
jgi:hypothetical protein